ncbi:unnamed protein product [Spodoptera littoralis]|uniref:Cytochrome n=1 Tax=Spodoptera littoralis TaxID=7109 RepID=A0A9P0I7N4_SPOLI|nr:unnamed protein product [Spodoptera littoralis]
MYIAVGLVLLCFVVLAVWTTWFRQKPDAPPLMPGILPIIGHSHHLIGDRTRELISFNFIFSLNLQKKILKWVTTFLTDPDDCLKLVNTCYSKSYIYDFAKDFINNGLITADAATWKVHRKLLNPAFNQQVLDTFINEMNIQARNVVSNLKNELDKKSFDVLRHIVSFTLSTVSRTSLGLTDEDQKIIDTDYAAAIDSIFALYCDRFQKVWLHLNFIFKWSEIKRKQDRLLKILHNIMIPVRYFCKFKPILDQMLQMASDHGVFSDEDIREHLDTLVAASYDTTSSAMTHMLLAIATYPEIQDRIYNEKGIFFRIQEVLENKDDDFTKHDLQKLVYLEAVMKETLRLHSATPIIGRKVDVDVKLNVFYYIPENCTLRANSTCVIGVYALHRHPLWGPDANEFKPERWLDPSISSLLEKPALFAAFGIGKRHCIGNSYSMLMMKIALAHIVRQYHISGDINKVVCEFDIVLKPVSGHHIGLKLRS